MGWLYGNLGTRPSVRLHLPETFRPLVNPHLYRSSLRKQIQELQQSPLREITNSVLVKPVILFVKMFVSVVGYLALAGGLLVCTDTSHFKNMCICGILTIDGACLNLTPLVSPGHPVSPPSAPAAHLSRALFSQID